MLPNKLKPKHTFDLIRIGNLNDGGYLVEKESHTNSKFLLGLGINDDWSFEVGFSKPYLGIDNNISFNFLIKKTLSYIPNSIKKQGFLRLIKSIQNIFYFIFNKNFFLKAYVSNFSNIDSSIISLHKIITDYCSQDDYGFIFLKIDIEGSEYRVLDDIIKYQEYFSGIIIEFHDIDLHMKKIINFIEKLNMNLVHIHPNNYAGIDKLNDPLVIELTFSRSNNYTSKEYTHPHNLDFPNDKNSIDIKLKFSNK